MAYTRHGHQIAGTPADGKQPEQIARCGGPGLCRDCSLEAAATPKETHTEFTMYTVHGALVRSGLSSQQATDAITELQNSGILFRERAR